MKQQKTSALPIFAVRLGELLTSKRVTQQQVAAATGVAQSTISHYLRGTRAKPRIEEVLALAAYFATPVEWLFGVDAPAHSYDSTYAAGQQAKIDEMRKIVASILEQTSTLQRLLGEREENQSSRGNRKRSQH